MNGFFDAGSNAIYEIYQSFLMALAAAYQEGIGAQDPTAPAVRTRMHNSTLIACSAMLTSCKAVMESYSRKVIDDALKAAKSNDPDIHSRVSEVARDGADGVLAILATAAARDMENTLKRWRAFVFQVDVNMRTGMTRSAATISARVAYDKMNGSIVMVQLDRGGKRWESATYAHAATRGYFVTTWVETFLFAAATQGEDLFRVVVSAPTHEHSDLLFTLSGRNQALPTYADLKNKVWHPNSRASVEVAHAI